MDDVELRIERPKRLAEGRIQGVDRSVSLRRRVEDLAVHLDLDRRLGQELAAGSLLDEAGVVEHLERGGIVGLVAPDEELE